MKTNIVYRDLKSPVGPLRLYADNTHIVAVLWDGDVGRVKVDPEAKRASRDHALLNRAASQLEEYFKGQREAFDLPLAMKGTDFQKAVWKQLRAIPYGKTRTYGELAAKVGNPAASRAVGSANNRNPLSIFIPCHRVVGANGSLTGFAGGLGAKEYLLKLEARERK